MFCGTQFITNCRPVTLSSFVTDFLITRMSANNYLTITLLGCLFVGTLCQIYEANDPELAGPFCALHFSPSQCPQDRNDAGVPFFGTECYCDVFCDRGESGDCCPDYWSHCYSNGKAESA